MSIPDTFLSDLVRTILIMSLSGSVLTLVLMLIKPLMRRRIPRSVLYPIVNCQLSIGAAPCQLYRFMI